MLSAGEVYVKKTPECETLLSKLETEVSVKKKTKPQAIKELENAHCTVEQSSTEVSATGQNTPSSDEEVAPLPTSKYTPADPDQPDIKKMAFLQTCNDLYNKIFHKGAIKEAEQHIKNAQKFLQNFYKGEQRTKKDGTTYFNGCEEVYKIHPDECKGHEQECIQGCKDSKIEKAESEITKAKKDCPECFLDPDWKAETKYNDFETDLQSKEKSLAPKAKTQAPPPTTTPAKSSEASSSQTPEGTSDNGQSSAAGEAPAPAESGNPPPAEGTGEPEPGQKTKTESGSEGEKAKAPAKKVGAKKAHKPKCDPADPSCSSA